MSDATFRSAYTTDLFLGESMRRDPCTQLSPLHPDYGESITRPDFAQILKKLRLIRFSVKILLRFAGYKIAPSEGYWPVNIKFY